MEQTCTEFLTRSPLASQGLSHLPPGPGAQPLASCLITQGHAPFVGSALPVALPHPASSSRPAQAPHGIRVLLLLFPTRDTRGAQRLPVLLVSKIGVSGRLETHLQPENPSGSFCVSVFLPGLGCQ